MVELNANTSVMDSSEAGEPEVESEDVLFGLASAHKPEAEMSADSANVVDKQARSVSVYWTVAGLLLVSAFVFSIVIVSHQNRPELPEAIVNQLDEVDTMKQELARMHEQKEAMQRERDRALATAQQEQQRRELEVQAAVEAARQEIEAMTAAALEAEKASKAAQQKEDLANRQRIEKERQRAEHERIQRKKLQAELEQQRLEQQRRQAALDEERLQLERAKKEKLALEEHQRKVAKEQAELFRSLEESEPAATVAKESPQSETERRRPSFTTDPCSSPSARFLSTCK